MDFFTFMFLVVLVGAISSVIRTGVKHRAERRREFPGGTRHDYQAWKEGQKVIERNTQKEIELFKLKKAERDEARKVYEGLVREKLEVMKLAISMGLDKQQLDDLDARLEKLIGADRLASLLQEEGKAPEPAPELMDTDLEAELARLKERRRTRASSQ